MDTVFYVKAKRSTFSVWNRILKLRISVGSISEPRSIRSSSVVIKDILFGLHRVNFWFGLTSFGARKFCLAHVVNIFIAIWMIWSVKFASIISTSNLLPIYRRSSIRLKLVLTLHSSPIPHNKIRSLARVQPDPTAISNGE